MPLNESYYNLQGPLQVCLLGWHNLLIKGVISATPLFFVYILRDMIN